VKEKGDDKLENSMELANLDDGSGIESSDSLWTSNNTNGRDTPSREDRETPQKEASSPTPRRDRELTKEKTRKSKKDKRKTKKS